VLLLVTPSASKMNTELSEEILYDDECVTKWQIDCELKYLAVRKEESFVGSVSDCPPENHAASNMAMQAEISDGSPPPCLLFK